MLYCMKYQLESFMDIWLLYRKMLFSRLFEEAVSQLWDEGKILGEMHLGTGEEAIVAAVVSQLMPGDAMALDHRGTSALLMRGIDPALLLNELLGKPDGLCGGFGGHMHLFWPEQLIASSGIVGSSGPAAAGFALAALHLRPGTVTVAFFGEGAVNEGMLMESFNLAAVWKLPVLFVCKDNNWAISTPSHEVTAGKLTERAGSFGMPVFEADGWTIEEVWSAAHKALNILRTRQGPAYLQARCIHLEGHFLGDPLLKMVRKPLTELAKTAAGLVRSAVSSKGASLTERTAGIGEMMGLISRTFRDKFEHKKDPLVETRVLLETDLGRLKSLEKEVVEEIKLIFQTMLQ
jgi:TPP-dependent pyruvate/acetoin dehydrogenase alpha subunit